MSGSSGEKTEKATPKKRRDEREKGNVMRSQDFATSVVLLGMFGMLRLTAPFMGRNMQRIISDSIPGVSTRQGVLTIHDLMTFFGDLLPVMISVMGPVFLFAVLAAALVNVLQTGFLFTTKTLEVKADRLNPVNGAKRIFSSRIVAEMVKSIAKIAIVLISVYQVFTADISRIAALLSYDIGTATSMLADLIFGLAFRVAIILVILAIFDYIYQWWKYEKDLRMTKQEVKDEYKNMEGSPQNKGRIRRIQREMSMQRMMQDVPQADVVVTNPTHYAVALRYQPQQDAAPVVLAKGQDLVARRIKEIAAEHDIVQVENVMLARSLYAYCDIGQQIPAELYSAVAEVLAYVARLKEEVSL